MTETLVCVEMCYLCIICSIYNKTNKEDNPVATMCKRYGQVELSQNLVKGENGTCKMYSSVFFLLHGKRMILYQVNCVVFLLLLILDTAANEIQCTKRTYTHKNFPFIAIIKYTWRVPVLGGPKIGENGQFVCLSMGFLKEFAVGSSTFSTYQGEFCFVFLLFYTIDGN